MTRRIRHTFFILLVIGLAPVRPIFAESIGDFFRRLGNSIAHPQQHPTPHPHSGKGHAASASPTPVNTTPAAPSATPSVPIKAASVSEVKNSKRDVPYGIPVPNKEGFVTSPYAPNQGMVDVRGIPSGTEVKDPFTGKIFLNP